MLAISCLCISCKTTNPSGKVIASVATTVDSMMKGWAIWVHAGYATKEQEAKVEAAWLKYKALEATAQKAYRAAYAAKDDSSMAQIVAAVQAASADLNLLIVTFKSGGK